MDETYKFGDFYNFQKYWCMYKLSYFLFTDAIKSLYYTLVHPYVHYGNIVWANPSKLSRILLLQKRAVRIIAKTAIVLNQFSTKIYLGTIAGYPASLATLCSWIRVYAFIINS